MASSTLDNAAFPNPSGLAVLRRLLADIRGRARRWIWIESLSWIGLAAAAIFWGSLAFDWSVEPPAWVRLTIAGLGAALLVGLAIVKLVLRLLTPLPDESLALVVERGIPGFRDSLSTAIGLASGDRPDVDRDLLARTTADAVAMLGEVRTEKIFRRRRLALLGFAAATAVATIGCLAAAEPAAVGLWARRMLGVSDRPWPRRVGLVADGFPGGVRTVARGSDVDVIVHATVQGRLPELVELRSRGPAGWRTERMGTRGAATAEGQTFGHMLRGVAEDTELEIRGGDARLRGLRLRVVESPLLAKLEIDYQLPEYLGGGSRRAAAARLVRIPRGSTIRLTCTSSKPLAAATVAVREAVPAGDDEPVTERIVAEFVPSAGTDRTLAASLGPLDADATVIVRLTDTDGLENRDPISFAISAIADDSPQVAVRLLGISTAVTPRGRLLFEGSITDDHGLAGAAARIDRRSAAAGPAAGEEDSRAFPIRRVRGGETLVELPVDAPEAVPLESLGLAPGGSLSVSVEGRDTCTLAGGPNVGRSDTWTLDVVTDDALQAMLEAREILLRRRFEAAVNEMQQARGLLVGPPPERAADDESGPPPAARCGEAASRAAGETGEIAAGFRLIRLELDNNALLTPEVEHRLLEQIAAPLAAIATRDLPELSRACAAAGRGAASAGLVARCDDVLARMRAVLDRMMELESFNEVLDRLRAVIRSQEEIRSATIEAQKKAGRKALEQP